jgi:acyl-coenzyme A synthetase/AMP-(fatty) acid ligase
MKPDESAADRGQPPRPSEADSPAAAPREASAHLDPFCREALPPHDLWPRMTFDRPELAYPPRLNAAAYLLDHHVAAGHGDRIALHYPGGTWTYRRLQATANRIAHALIDDLGIVPGNRVLLRGANTPMLVACWFAVLKAGAVAVTTMPLLRVRELSYIVTKARITLALTDLRVASDCEQAVLQASHAASAQDEAPPGNPSRRKAADGATPMRDATDRAQSMRAGTPARQRPRVICFHPDAEDPADDADSAGDTESPADSESAAGANCADSESAGDANSAPAAGLAGALPRADRPPETAGAATLWELARRKPATFANCDTAGDDTAIIAFTSGTTGQGKGTLHFHRDLLAATDCFPRHVLRPRADDIFCGSPPLAFTYGLGGLLLFPLRIGASTLLLEQATPPHLLAGIQEHRATVCFTAPTAYRALCGLLGPYDISSLRACVSAGETLPVATFEAWRRATGIRIIDGIGSTELLHMFISSAGDDIRPGATGRVIPGYEARVVDAAGQPVPPGILGRLAVRGPTGCRYLDNLERQLVYVQDGWNFTGDSYIEDEDGYFWYQARTDDMIISAGHNISGVEVESVLLEHPKVRECGVVGTPHPERGQIVTAFIVLEPSAPPEPNPDLAGLTKELQDFVKREIAPYKYPRRIEFVAALPRTETGKLQRFRLRELPPP